MIEIYIDEHGYTIYQDDEIISGLHDNIYLENDRIFCLQANPEDKNGNR